MTIERGPKNIIPCRQHHRHLTVPVWKPKSSCPSSSLNPPRRGQIHPISLHCWRGKGGNKSPITKNTTPKNIEADPCSLLPPSNSRRRGGGPAVVEAAEPWLWRCPLGRRDSREGAVILSFQSRLPNLVVTL
jgi:hypothetical protein